MSENRIHVLKTWPEPFAAMESGAKVHEVRVDDRGFMVGDLLCLQEWEPHGRAMPPWSLSSRWHSHSERGHYTGREIWRRVTYKTPGGSWGLPGNVCVLSVVPTEAPVAP